MSRHSNPAVRTPNVNYGQFSLFLEIAISSLNSIALIPLIMCMCTTDTLSFQSTDINLSYIRRENPTLSIQLNYLSLLFCFNRSLVFL